MVCAREIVSPPEEPELRVFVLLKAGELRTSSAIWWLRGELLRTTPTRHPRSVSAWPLYSVAFKPDRQNEK